MRVRPRIRRSVPGRDLLALARYIRGRALVDEPPIRRWFVVVLGAR